MSEEGRPSRKSGNFQLGKSENSRQTKSGDRNPPNKENKL